MIEIIKNILPEKINNKIILLLLKSANWKIAKDSFDDVKLLDDMLNNGEKSYGNSLISYQTSPRKEIYLETELNNYAEIIYEIVKSNTKYKFLKPIRFYWNFYNKAASASLHSDMEENYFVSFIYNLNTNNGGTNINNEFFKSNAGEAVVFKSNFLHSSVAQTDSVARFNLNCIVELERNI